MEGLVEMLADLEASDPGKPGRVRKLARLDFLVALARGSE
jgi:hypothetical protein